MSPLLCVMSVCRRLNPYTLTNFTSRLRDSFPQFWPRRGRGTDMKKLQSGAAFGGASNPLTTIARAVRWAAVTGGFVLLAACGGGGGGATTTPTPTPPPPPAATGNLAGTAGCTIVVENTTSCPGLIAWAAQNATALAVRAGTASVVANPPASGTASYTLALAAGSVTVTLADGSTTLATTTIAATCGSGLAANASGACVKLPTNYKFARLNIAVMADGKLARFDETGAVPLINSTGFVTGPNPVALCGIYVKNSDGTLALLPDGRPIASCVTPSAGNTRRVFPINPNSGELMPEYESPLSPDVTARDVSYGTNYGEPLASQGVLRPGYMVDIPAVGRFFFKNTDTVNLRLTTDNFATNRVVATNGFQFLATGTNP